MNHRHPNLYPAMSPNGRLVHLSDKDALPMCGSTIRAAYRVRSRITCSGCLRRRPVHAARHAHKPRAIGIDLNPFYEAIRQALDTGRFEPRETFKTLYDPEFNER